MKRGPVEKKKEMTIEIIKCKMRVEECQPMERKT
jgi:hypothetical protein